MATVYRANMPDLTLVKGIHMVIQHDWEQREAVGRSIFNIYDSEAATEDTKSVGAFSTFAVKQEGYPVEYEAPSDGFKQTFTHLTYGKGYRVTHEMQADELYGVIEGYAKDLTFAAHATEEAVLASIFNNAFSTTGYDGAALVSSAHVRENGATWTNLAASDLTRTSLETGIITFRNFRDGAGKRLQIRPRTLLVPPDLQFTAAVLLNSTVTSTYDTTGSAERSSGAINPISGLGLNIQVWDYLSDTGAWFLLAAPDQHKILLYDREPFADDMIYDFDTGDLKVKLTYRQSSGWAHANGVYGST